MRTKITVHVRTNTLIRIRDQRGKAKGRTKENERILKVLPVVAQKKVVAKVIVDPLLLMVTLMRVHQVLIEVGMLAGYVDVSLMGSTYRTKVAQIQLADLLQAKEIALLAMLGSKVIVLRVIHVRIGIFPIVAGIVEVNAQLGQIAYFFTAAELELSKMRLQKMLLRPNLKQKLKIKKEFNPKQKAKPKLKANQTPALLRNQWMKINSAQPRAP